MSGKIGIIDYGCGNIQSLINAFVQSGSQPELVSDATKLMAYDKLVLPGVGAFPQAMSMLTKNHFVEPLTEAKDKGLPILGICLGMQLLCRDSDEVSADSDENVVQGLGWINAKVRHFSALGATNIKVPHMGWNEIEFKSETAVFNGIKPHADVYFVHSHAVICDEDRHVLARCHYGVDFAAAIVDENLMGMQFHPEKSHRVGLKIIENFVGQ